MKKITLTIILIATVGFLFSQNIDTITGKSTIKKSKPANPILIRTIMTNRYIVAVETRFRD